MKVLISVVIFFNVLFYLLRKLESCIRCLKVNNIILLFIIDKDNDNEAMSDVLIEL